MFNPIISLLKTNYETIQNTNNQIFKFIFFKKNINYFFNQIFYYTFIFHKIMRYVGNFQAGKIFYLLYESEIIKEIQDAIKDNIEKEYLLFSTSSNTTEKNSLIHVENCITKVQTKNADILLGNIQYFKQILQVEENIFCVDQFQGSSFFVIFKKFYSKILAFNQHSSIEDQMRKTTDNIFVIYPFVSSDKEKYSQSSEIIEDLRQIRQFYQ